MNEWMNTLYFKRVQTELSSVSLFYSLSLSYCHLFVSLSYCYLSLSPTVMCLSNLLLIISYCPYHCFSLSPSLCFYLYIFLFHDVCSLSIFVSMTRRYECHGNNWFVLFVPVQGCKPQHTAACLTWAPLTSLLGQLWQPGDNHEFIIQFSGTNFLSACLYGSVHHHVLIISWLG